ncbi:MAG: OmpA family protein [Bacteroidetes bacterium]|nr:OmpA family protein [Bacteroidota bacterium]
MSIKQNGKLTAQLVAILLIINQFATAQDPAYSLPNPKKFDRFSFSILGGMSALHSDIKHKKEANSSLSQMVLNPAFGFQFGYQLTYTIGLRMRGFVTELKDTPIDSVYIKEFKDRYLLSYSSPVRQGSLSLVYNFGNITYLKRNQSFHMFVDAGLGLFSNQATVKQLPRGNAIIERDKTTELCIPFGLGFKYRIGHADLSVSYDYYKTFTDKIEGVAGENSAPDAFSLFSAALTFTFGKKNKPMEWINPMDVVYQDLNRMNAKVDSVANDSDGDGVADIFDKDNKTPKGAKTYSDGTLIDTDNDGVVDFKDADPFSAKGAKVDADGRELDTDGDGVPDIGSTVIKPVYQERLLIVARALKMNPNIKIALTGCTDVSGNDNFNEKLGLKRAENCKRVLVDDYGIEAERISTETKGNRQPLNTATDYLNRRVDFSVQ